MLEENIKKIFVSVYSSSPVLLFQTTHYQSLSFFGSKTCFKRTALLDQGGELLFIFYFILSRVGQCQALEIMTLESENI